MTREEMDQVVKEIHEYFIKKGANYFEAMYILNILNKQYERKISYNTENMLVSDIAKLTLHTAKAGGFLRSYYSIDVM